MCDEWPLLRCWQLVDKDLIYLLFTFKSISLLSTKTGSFIHQDNSHIGGSDDKARLEAVLRGDFSVLCSLSCPCHNTPTTRKYLSFCCEVVTTRAKQQQNPKLTTTRKKSGYQDWSCQPPCKKLAMQCLNIWIKQWYSQTSLIQTLRGEGGGIVSVRINTAGWI